MYNKFTYIYCVCVHTQMYACNTCTHIYLTIHIYNLSGPKTPAINRGSVRTQACGNTVSAAAGAPRGGVVTVGGNKLSNIMLRVNFNKFIYQSNFFFLRNILGQFFGAQKYSWEGGHKMGGICTSLKRFTCITNVKKKLTLLADFFNINFHIENVIIINYLILINF